jgi:hypothetical protein
VDGAVSSMTERHWNGRYHERWTYRWAEQLPLRKTADTLRVNWCELTIVKEATGEQLYHCSWATDHKIDRQSVVILGRDRRQWAQSLESGERGHQRPQEPGLQF